MSFFNTCYSNSFIQARFCCISLFRQDVKPQADFNLVFEVCLKKIRTYPDNHKTKIKG